MIIHQPQAYIRGHRVAVEMLFILNILFFFLLINDNVIHTYIFIYKEHL